MVTVGLRRIALDGYRWCFSGDAGWLNRYRLEETALHLYWF